MKTLLLPFVSLLLLLISCNPHSNKNLYEFTLSGDIIGKDSGIIILSYFHDNARILDTCEIKDGKFEFTGNVSEPTQAILSDKNDFNRVFIFLEPKKMKISFPKDDYEAFTMNGSKTQNEYDLLNKIENPFYERISVLRDQINKINDSIKNSKDVHFKTLLEKRAEQISIQRAHTLKQIDSVTLNHILKNPKSFVAVFNLRKLESSEIISLDSTKSIFNGLDNSLKESSYGKNIKDNIRKKENIRLGVQPPDFKATDIKQQTITLSQFKGKNVVLLDFWASWCEPCRKSLPHLKAIYNKYHDEGFEIIAVSTDHSRKEWIEAVKQDSTEMWHHILIAEKWPNGPITNDDIFQNYMNTAIPEQILIDKNGKIIYRHVGYSKESEESLDSFLSRLFIN